MANLVNDLNVNLNYQHLQFTDKKRNESQKKMIKKYFHFDSEDRTIGLCTELYDFDVDKLKEQIKKIKNKDRIRFFPDLNLSDVERYYNDLDGYTHSEYCTHPWKEARINPHGEIVNCIMEPNAGCLSNSTFKEIWNNKDMRHFRKILRKEKLFPNCARCCKI